MNENVLQTCLHLSLLEQKETTPNLMEVHFVVTFSFCQHELGITCKWLTWGGKNTVCFCHLLWSAFSICIYYFVTCYWSSFCMVWNVLHSSVCVWVCWNKNTEGKKRGWGEENALAMQLSNPFSSLFFLSSLSIIHLASLSVLLSPFVPCAPA